MRLSETFVINTLTVKHLLIKNVLLDFHRSVYHGSKDRHHNIIHMDWHRDNYGYLSVVHTGSTNIVVEVESVIFHNNNIILRGRYCLHYCQYQWKFVLAVD